MPSSWQARMIRTAISPRFATRTRRNGGPAASTSSTGPVASLCKDGPLVLAAASLEGDVPMLLSGIGVALVGQHLEGPDDPGPRLHGPDHVIDVAPAGGDIGVREARAIFLDELPPNGGRILGRGDLVLEDD